MRKRFAENDVLPPRSPRLRAVVLSLLCLVPVFNARATTTTNLGYLADMDLNELTSLTVTLVSRRDEAVFTTPAAVRVLSSEQIRRSGVTSIPEALRLVPGLQVARMEANKWAITSRGFDGRYARHMLVQVDGRSVYNLLTSGVFWEVQDVMLEDIDRIEVIRGPGSTMWGANAVNGIVNIVTRPATETLGTLLSVGAGTEERAFTSARHGIRLGDDAALRVYMKANDHDAGRVNSQNGQDAWRSQRGGFRLDWAPGPRDDLTLQGDIYDGCAGQLLLSPDPIYDFVPYIENVTFSGGNLLMRWKREIGSASSLAVQTYYDSSRHDEITYAETRETFDIDAQHRIIVNDYNDLIWGTAYRLTADDLRDSPTQWYTQDSRTDTLYSLFLQNNIHLIPACLSLAIGSKLEHNDYTGWEIQPGVRLTYTPAPNLTTWAGVQRAVRTPSRIEHTMRLKRSLRRPGMTFFGQNVIQAVMMGDDAYASEDLIAYELGQRIQVSRSLGLDIATFYSDYSDLQSVEPADVTVSPVPFLLRNNLTGEAYGAEISAHWQPLDWWRVEGFYALMMLDLHTADTSHDIFTEDTFEGDVPRHQAGLLSSMNVSDRLDLNTWLRYVDEIRIEDLGHYLELDANVTWHATGNLHITLAVQNALDRSHYEYGPSFLLTTQSTEVERGIYGKVTMTF